MLGSESSHKPVLLTTVAIIVYYRVIMAYNE